MTSALERARDRETKEVLLPMQSDEITFALADVSRLKALTCKKVERTRKSEIPPLLRLEPSL